MKIRIWYCPCCHKNIRRYRNDDSNKKKICNRCKIDLVSGRKKVSWKNCKHNRTAKKIQKFENAYYSKPRNAGGKVLKISPETKKLWKLVDKAKTRPALFRKAEKWLESLNKDIFNVTENDYAKRIPDRTYTDKGIFELQKSREGFRNPPKLIYKTDESLYEKGHFQSWIVNNVYEITIWKLKSLLDIKMTLLHEVLHLIDSKSDTPAKHDHFFEQRLAWLVKKFKVKY